LAQDAYIAESALAEKYPLDEGRQILLQSLVR
jgi:hypothetical protein